MEDGRQFIPLYFDVLTSKLYRNISGNALQLYWMMRRYVCRARSGHGLSLFYMGGALAVSGYLASYAKLFGVSDTTVGRWVKELEEHDVLKTYQKGTDKRPSAWILGKVQHIEGSQWGNELFFLDHLAVAQEEDNDTIMAFDDGQIDECLGPKLSKLNLTTALLQVQMQVQMQVFNREERIDKTNTLPPVPGDEEEIEYPVKQERIVTAPSLPESEYVDLDETGYPTLAKHPLVKHIERNARRTLTPNQQSKLMQGVPFHNPRWPSPAKLFESTPLFAEYIDDKISWATGGKSGKRKTTQNLITAIRNYDEEYHGWLNFQQARLEEKEPPPSPVAGFKMVERPPRE